MLAAETDGSARYDRCRRRGSTQSFQPRRDSPRELACGPVAVADALHHDGRLHAIFCLDLASPPPPVKDKGNHTVHNASSNHPAGWYTHKMQRTRRVGNDIIAKKKRRGGRNHETTGNEMAGR